MYEKPIPILQITDYQFDKIKSKSTLSACVTVGCTDMIQGIRIRIFLNVECGMSNAEVRMRNCILVINTSKTHHIFKLFHPHIRTSVHKSATFHSPFMWFGGYSLRKLFTGFVNAAFTDWKLIVISAIAIADEAAATGTHHCIFCR